jgi:putative two-component system response regulator
VDSRSTLEHPTLAAAIDRWQSLVARTARVESAPLEAGARLTPPVASPKIVVVDDEPHNAHEIARQLAPVGMTEFAWTSNSTTALDFLHDERPDVLLLDLQMPGCDGIKLLQQIRNDADLAHVPTLVLTEVKNRELERCALELGALDFLRKPVDALELVPRVRNAWSVKSYQDQLEHQARELDRAVRERTAELALSRLELIHCLGRAAEYRDNETGRHVVRVGRYAGIIARQLKLEPRMIELLELAAPLHDVGKIGIPDAILRKPGSLAVDEFRIMQSHCDLGLRIFHDASEGSLNDLVEHPQLGGSFISEYVSPVLRMASSIAVTHHERWDGTGYPKGLKGNDIPIEGRVTAVADVFDALSTKRAYKPAFPLEKCLDILREGRGSHFDPMVLDAFFARLDEVLDVFREFGDADQDEIDVTQLH